MDKDHVAVAHFSRCSVPDVRGKRLGRAKKAIRRSFCSVHKVHSAFSRSVEKGHVVSQRPRPGKKLRAHGKVNLTVSKGPRG